MSENLVHIDADRLLKWGLDAYERGRAAGKAEAAPEEEGWVKPYPVVEQYEITPLGSDNPDAYPHRITVTLSDGNVYRGVFRG